MTATHTVRCFSYRSQEWVLFEAFNPILRACRIKDAGWTRVEGDKPEDADAGRQNSSVDMDQSYSGLI